MATGAKAKPRKASRSLPLDDDEGRIRCAKPAPQLASAYARLEIDTGDRIGIVWFVPFDATARGGA